MINNKELYCLYRARELNECRRITLCQGWEQAEREWSSCKCVPRKMDCREDNYDDDMEIND